MGEGRSPEATDLVNQVDDVAPLADTPAELLGLVVGRALGLALAERDQARALVQELGTRLAESATHLSNVLEAAPAVSSFAKTNDHLDDARAFLADVQGPRQVGSSQSPEQESPRAQS